MSPDFANPSPGLLTPYTALVLFSLSVVFSTPFFLPVLRRYASKPADGEIFYMDVSKRNHQIAILGGGGLVSGYGIEFAGLRSGWASY